MVRKIYKFLIGGPKYTEIVKVDLLQKNWGEDSGYGI